MENIDYSKYSLNELYQVRDDVNKDAYPERFEAICREIDIKESNLPSEADIDNLPDDTVAAINKWFVRFISVVTIGGAFTGITLFTSNFQSISGIINHLIYIAFICVYIWGICTSVRLFENKTVGTLRENLLFWQIQIPIFMSPLLGYQFANGLFLNVWVSSNSGFEYAATIGSVFNFVVFQYHQPWAIGVNLFAVAISIAIYRHIKNCVK
ncbi:hypothetical protein [Rheinheimera nanhaiensis]|uniref:hypothetical protein n=1 Tax=Rheinheimera nanhaiensis TaxID=1163621 RepID=UPI000590C7F8|nr:hypothetical protein [Rheinheimera nanhaiensis]